MDAVQVAGKLSIHPEGTRRRFSSQSVPINSMDLKVSACSIITICILTTLLHGGEQEEKRRASTENLVGIAGMTAAYKQQASDHYQDNYQHVEKIRQAFLDTLTVSL